MAKIGGSIVVARNEIGLRAFAGDQLAIIERPNRKRLQLEVAGESNGPLRKLTNEFGA